MMDRQLSITSILRHGAQVHGRSTVSSRFGAEAPHRYTYADAWRRAQQLANVLRQLGVKEGDRIGTIAWNDHRHFELYYAVPGIGAICHTINPRLSREQLVYIVNHARDQWLFVDPMFVPLVAAVWSQLKSVRGIVVMTQPDRVPASTLPTVHCYETLMVSAGSEFDWPELDERTAAGLCYTSGTTGEPKGVLYSHRSTVLHAYGCFTVPGAALRTDDTALLVVPLFHVNAWGYPHAAPIIGANLVMPGPKLDGASLYALMESERVTLSSGVPTLWLGLLNHLRDTGAKLSTVRRLTSGGSAMPRAMLEEFENSYGIEMFQGWGMTETSPLGTFASLAPDMQSESRERQHEVKLTAGRAIFGVEIRVLDGNGRPLPHDGVAQGELAVRGPWITNGYYLNPEATKNAITPDGWFLTGDIGRIDARGYVTLVDRSKDIIKSGGEWISSATLERLVLGHPAVAEAAVIGVPHPKWQERPLLLVVARKGSEISKQALIEFLAPHVPKWWLPDDVVAVERFPYGATGKIQKSLLRRQFAEYKLSA
ncbi:MAG: long-chain fatty acid--CoA ligase [Steroidobacteraceae bacterium]